MQKYVVTALSVPGAGNKMYKAGDLVNELAFSGGLAKKLEASGFIKKTGYGDLDASKFNPPAEHLAIVLDSAPQVFSSVVAALKDEVENKEEYRGRVYVVGYVILNFSDIKKQFPKSKIIVYQLEQLCSATSLFCGAHHRGKNTLEWLNGADEVLDYAIENIDFLRANGIPAEKIKYRPLGYSDKLLVEDYDALFYGYINERRYKLLLAVSKRFNLCVIGKSSVDTEGLDVIPPKYNADLWGYIKRSKVVLNIHYYEIQEQVRIAELLANGVQVLSEVSPINYYKGLLTEFNGEAELVTKLAELLKRKPRSKVAAFKKLVFPEPEEPKPIEDDRLTIYTSFTEGYDRPRSDVKFIPAEVGRYKNDAKNAGIVKHLYWKYGVETPFNMWVDGSIYPTEAPEVYLDMLGDNDIVLFRHPWRDCIYKEIDETLRLKFDLPEIAEPIAKRYRKEGYPERNGLGETGVLIRRDSKLVRRFFSELWKEIASGSHRDQLAFNYVLKKFPKLRVKYLPPSVRNNPAFKMIIHEKHVTNVDGKLIAKSVK